MNFRFEALKLTLSRSIDKKIKPPSPKISEFYGDMVFNMVSMHQYLSEEAYQTLINAIEKGENIERKLADQVASSMKAWAMSKGATHYTHWFHPLTGATAEKHDAFILPVNGGKAMENFHGSMTKNCAAGKYQIGPGSV